MLADAEQHQRSSKSARGEAENFLSDIRRLQSEIGERIYAINRFGTSHHHINLPAAMEEANTLLRTIDEIAHHRNQIIYGPRCADEAFDFWLNTSLIIGHQANETNRLHSNVVSKRNRLDDLIEIAYKTQRLHSHTNETHLSNVRRFDDLQHRNQHISRLLYEIRDLFNTSVVPQTDTMLELIADGSAKLAQDIRTIGRLRDVVNETGALCEESLRSIRDNLLPEASARSIDLAVRAEEYAKLFRNTKNGAEVAILASTAYKNISDSIESARRSAIEAELASRKSELELYPSDDDAVIAKSLASLRKSQEIKENAVREIDKVAGNLLLQ